MKRLSIFILVCLFSASLGFAQAALTIQGAYYGDKNKDSPSSVAERFQKGEGIFYGLGAEFLLGNISAGTAINFSFYDEDLWGVGFYVPMWDYDIMFYGGYHFLGATSFLDPFVEAGLGFMAQDYAVSEYDGLQIDPDPGNPIRASTYMYLGLGMGVNFGKIGAFLKTSYNFPVGEPVTGTSTIYTDDGFEYEVEYDLAAYPISNLKVMLGARLVL